ncbi:hypothetical protein HCZ88_07585 [Limosilactobacillus fermentum]
MLAIIGSEKKSEYGVYTVICLLSFMLFIFIPKMPIYATENYKDVEYSKDGKKPYNTHIKNLSGNTYSIITEDSFTGEHYLEATRKGNNFIVDDDDVRDNYIDGVSEVKFTLEDGGRKIKEYDYSKYSNKPTKGETQKLIQQKE